MKTDQTQGRITRIGCVVAVWVLMGAGLTNGQTTKPLPAAAEGVLIERNVSYLGDGRDEKLDLYLPAGRQDGTRSPAIVIIHGGGWVNGDKAAGREFEEGTTLAKAGYVCASVNYWMKEQGRWPQNLMDCKNAVRFLRANAEKYRVDGEKMGVIGGSAGGHLALMVAYTTGVDELEPKQPYPGVSDRVSAVVDMYGITDLLTRRKTDPDGKPIGEVERKTALLATSAAEDADAWKRASPVYCATKDSPPTLILHGTRDTTVDRDQATELEAKLAQLGVPHQLIWAEGAGHTFDFETWAKKPMKRDLRPVVVGFFDRWVRGEK